MGSCLSLCSYFQNDKDERVPLRPGKNTRMGIAFERNTALAETVNIKRATEEKAFLDQTMKEIMDGLSTGSSDGFNIEDAEDYESVLQTIEAESSDK